MKILHAIQSNGRPQVVRLGITMGLATLFLAVLSWASASNAPTIASPSVAQETTTLNSGNVITIGVAAALGTYPELGWPQANSVQLAISQTNAAGGVDIGGVAYTVTLVIADSACDATQAVTAANTLLNAGAVAVVGHSCSSASFAAQPIYSAADIPMVSPSSTNPDVTQQGYTTTFRTTSHDGAGPSLLANHFRGWVGLSNSAIVERPDGWCDLMADAYENTFTALGGTITSRRVATDTSDFFAVLTAIKAEDPDVIFYADTDGARGGLFSFTAYGLGMTNVVIGWSSDWAEDAYATAAGPAAEGDYAGMLRRRTDDMPGYGTFNVAYQEASFPNYGDEAQMYGAFAYDAAKIIIAAIDHADTSDPTAIRDEIAATADYDGVVGTYESFDSNGDVIPQWAWLMKYQNGQWVVLHPSKVFLPLVLNGFQ